MKDETQRLQAIDALATALEKDAKLVTLEMSDDGLGLHLKWSGGRGMSVRTKRVRADDGWTLWYVEPPGHLIAEISDVRGAVKVIRDLSGEQVR